MAKGLPYQQAPFLTDANFEIIFFKASNILISLSSASINSP